MKILLSIASVFLLAFPAIAEAAPFLNPIVPEACQACPCGFGGVLQIIQNLMNFGIGIAILVATIIIAWGGFLYIMSSANPESRSKANKMLINAAIGLFIVLSAWLIVDFVMKSLYDGETSRFGPWNTIISGEGDICIKENENVKSLFSRGITATPGASGPGGTGVTGTSGCPTCVPLSSKGLSCTTPAQNCTLNPAVADRLVALKNGYSGTWVITEAFPPRYQSHSNPCHTTYGTCVDADITGQTSDATIKAFMDAAKAAGLRPVYETEDCAERTRIKNAGYEAFCKSDSGYGRITGSHFSLYGSY